MSRRYASLIGPLLGVYYPLPEGLNPRQERIAMNTSRLKLLWHNVYDEGEVDSQIREFGGTKLPDSCAKNLDYDSYEVGRAQ
jgi:hypothetical protein